MMPPGPNGTDCAPLSNAEPVILLSGAGGTIGGAGAGAMTGDGAVAIVGDGAGAMVGDGAGAMGPADGPGAGGANDMGGPGGVAGLAAAATLSPKAPRCWLNLLFPAIIALTILEIAPGTVGFFSCLV
jgi:hypothetical protein